MSAPRIRLLLFCILCLAAGLRLWGIGFSAGQPVARPDEQIFALEGLNLFTHSFARFGWGFPAGYFELFHYALRAERHLYGAATNLACLLAVRPLAVYLPLRLCSAALSTLTILPVHATARALRDERAGLFAAAACAVNYLAVRDGHFAVSDAPLALGVALSLWACTRAVDDARWLVPAAACAGAAFSVKYAAAGLAVPCLAAALLRLRAGTRWPQALALPLAAALAAFVALSPTVFLDLRHFFRGLADHGMRYGEADGLRWYGLVVLPAACGRVGAVAACAGLLFALRARRALPVALYALVFFFGVLGPVRITHVRYASPLVPALAAGIGVALSLALARSRLAAALLGAAVLLPPAVRAARFDHLLAQPDTRDLASRWLVARGEPIESLGGWAHVHALEDGAQKACAAALPARLQQPLPLLAGESAPWKELVAAGESGWEPLGQLLVRRHLNRAPLPQARLVVQGIGAYQDDAPPPPPLDEACWQPLRIFAPSATPAPGGGPVFDRWDAFFVPFAGLRGVQHPGPTVVIRRRACP